VQDEACMVFEEIKGQGSQLDQVVVTVEQCLEGPVLTGICDMPSTGRSNPDRGFLNNPSHLE
jgi:hypothetical protein